MLPLSGLEGIFMYLNVVSTKPFSREEIQEQLTPVTKNTHQKEEKQCNQCCVTTTSISQERESVEEEKVTLQRAKMRKALSDSMPSQSDLRKYLIYYAEQKNYKFPIGMIGSAGRITLIDLYISLIET